jgi:hypothetical protein
VYLKIGGMWDAKGFFCQTRRFSAGIRTDFKGNQRSMAKKYLTGGVLTMFSYTFGAFKKEPSLCRKDTRTE